MKRKRVFFKELPTVSVTGQVRDYQPVTVSTAGMTVEGFYVEVDAPAEDELSLESYVEALIIVLEQLQDPIINQVNQIIQKRLNPPSSL